MRKIFLLSICLIGVGLTACQKDEMPEAPASQEKGIISPFYFSPSEATMYAQPMEPGEHEAFFTLCREGYPVAFTLNKNDLQLIDLDSGSPVTPYIMIPGSFQNGARIVFKNSGFGPNTPSGRAKLIYTSSSGETATAIVTVRYR